MGLWYDPNRQVIVDKDRGKYLYIYSWCAPIIIWFIPGRYDG